MYLTYKDSNAPRIFMAEPSASDVSILMSMPLVQASCGSISVPPIPALIRNISETLDAEPVGAVKEILDAESEASAFVSNYEDEIASYTKRIPWQDKLHKYQKETIAFGLARKHFICSDDRGLGKTLEALTLCVAADAKNVLVVAPTYLKYNWQREILDWTLIYKVFNAAGTRKERDSIIQSYRDYGGYKILLVNYEMLRLSESSGGYKDILNGTYDIAVYDEAHRLKGRNSKWSKGAEIIAKNAEYVAMLTGNPIDKNPDDIWSLLHILYPKQFTSYWSFVNTFCNVRETYFGREISGINKNYESYLVDILRSYVIRHTKDTAAPYLPKKQYREILVEMPAKQSKFYKTIEKEMLIEMESGKTEDIPTFATQHLRLCQAAVCPESIEGPEESCVTDAVVSLCEDICETERKVIVAAYFVAHADAIEKGLVTSRHYRVFRISATLNAEERDNVVSQFKSYNGKEPAILVGTIKTMSEGLNIDECNCMIFADKAFTPMPNEQMEDRIHRITSTVPKTYYSIIARNTVQYDKEKVLKKRAYDRDEMWARMQTIDSIKERNAHGIQKSSKKAKRNNGN